MESLSADIVGDEQASGMADGDPDGPAMRHVADTEAGQHVDRAGTLIQSLEHV